MIRYFLFFLSSIAFFINAPNFMDRGYMALEVLFTFLFSILFMFDNIKSNRMGFFRHSNIFVIVFLILFYQLYVDYVLGLIDVSETYIWIDQSIVPKSLAVCNMSLSCFLLGYKTKRSMQLNDRLAEEKIEFKYKYPEKSYLCTLGFLMFAYFIITADSGFFRSGYLTSEGELGASFGIMVLLQSVIIATFTLYCFEYKNASVKKSVIHFFKRPAILVFLYVIAVLLSGRRTEALRVLIMLLFVYIYILNNKLNTKKIFIAVLLGVFLSGVFGVIRGQESSFSDGVKLLTSSDTISPFTRELASSINTVHIAMSYVPEPFPFNMGLTFFPSFAILIPGLDRLITSLVPNNWILNSSSQISTMYWGDDWAYGLGSSIVADVYVSFGVVGVCIIFLLLGRFFKTIENLTATTNNVYLFALCMGTYSQILYACRTGVGVLFLSWTYACIFIYLSRFISSTQYKMHRR